MTYLRRHAIVIRDLTTHAERVVPVTDKLWRAEVDRGGRCIVDTTFAVSGSTTPRMGSLPRCRVTVTRLPPASRA